MRIGLTVFTRSTLTPLDNIGVMTMKMMSSTSITSTIGVTLISATGGGDFDFIITDIVKTSNSGWVWGVPEGAGTPRFNSPCKLHRLKPVLPYSTGQKACFTYLRAAARCDR